MITHKIYVLLRNQKNMNIFWLEKTPLYLELWSIVIYIYSLDLLEFTIKVLTVIALSIGTPYLFTILLLKFEIIHFTTSRCV